jgi:hypothetical protein
MGDAEGRAWAWRLTREAWWLEGEGRVGSGRSRTAVLAWALDPLERTLALEAAVTVGWSSPAVVDGTVDAGGASTGDASADAHCEPWRTSLETRYASDPLETFAALPSADTLPALGLLELGDLLDAAQPSLSGVVSPVPVESLGDCVEREPSNWGDPEHPWRPCGQLLPLRGSRGDLRMDGGVGQGVLVVDGNLDLVGGARFHGLAMVSGALRVDGEAQLIGMAVAWGGVQIGSAGSVRGSGCWVARALAAQRATLGGLRLPPEAGFLGPL